MCTFYLNKCGLYEIKTWRFKYENITQEPHHTTDEWAKEINVRVKRKVKKEIEGDIHFQSKNSCSGLIGYLSFLWFESLLYLTLSLFISFTWFKHLKPLKIKTMEEWMDTMWSDGEEEE